MFSNTSFFNVRDSDCHFPSDVKNVILFFVLCNLTSLSLSSHALLSHYGYARICLFLASSSSGLCLCARSINIHLLLALVSSCSVQLFLAE